MPETSLPSVIQIPPTRVLPVAFEIVPPPGTDCEGCKFRKRAYCTGALSEQALLLLRSYAIEKIQEGLFEFKPDCGVTANNLKESMQRAA